MAPLLIWIIGSASLVSTISLIGVFTLPIRDDDLRKILFGLVGFSAGALMGGAFLHLMPEALESSESTIVFSHVIIGFMLFFLLERLLYWRHCHEGKCDVHVFTYLNLIGDAIHNFVDGLTLAASFVAGIQLGIIATIAVVTHEIPQELGDFGVLLYGGFTKTKALSYNFLSQLTAVVGAMVGYLLSSNVESFAALIVPIAAGGFIYISASDLIPELHKEREVKKSMLSFGTFLVGILLMWILKLALEP